MTFKVGELIEVRSVVGRFPGWIEETIMDIYTGRRSLESGRFYPDASGPLTVHVFANKLVALAENMRKKRPPEQLAGSWEEVMREFKQGKPA